MQLNRFRKQAARRPQTTFYRNLFHELGMDPKRLAIDDSGSQLRRRIPCGQTLTNSVTASSKPELRAMTTGTTGWPTSVYFSNDEVRLIVAITASHVLLRRFVDPDDIVQVCLSSRAIIALASVMGSCAYVGAPAYLAGLVELAHVLALLREQRSIPAKGRRQASWNIYPSHLGEVVEYGLAHNYRSEEFGLRRIIVGGELVTNGLKARAQKLFGAVSFEENHARLKPCPWRNAVFGGASPFRGFCWSDGADLTGRRWSGSAGATWPNRSHTLPTVSPKHSLAAVRHGGHRHSNRRTTELRTAGFPSHVATTW